MITGDREKEGVREKRKLSETGKGGVFPERAFGVF